MLNQIFISLLLTLCGEDPEVLDRVNLPQVAERMRRYLSSLPPFYHFALVSALLLFEFMPYPISNKWRRFSRLPLDTRLRVVHQWLESSFFLKHLMMKGIRSFCIMQLYAEPKLLEHLAYEGRQKCQN